MKQFFNLLFSFKTTIILLAILGISAAIATFIENDFGTSSARVLVYNNLWYEIILVLTMVNLISIIFKYKMWKNKARFIFHASFVVILIGAAMTRYIGYEGIIHIREGQTQNKMISLEPYLQVKIKQKDKSYYKEYPIELTALGSNYFKHKIKLADKELQIEFKHYNYSKTNQTKSNYLIINAKLNNKSRSVKLIGTRGEQGIKKVEDFGDTIVTFEYGSKTLKLPFSIHLRDFQLERYAGSMSPSSYASEITVINTDNSSYDYRIYMNRTLHQGNFLFFQSSYDQDEKGTILSVNNDPGKWPTYLGYFLLTLGLLLNFFDKKSRFWKLTKYVKNKNLAIVVFSLLFFQNTNILHASEKTKLEEKQQAVQIYLKEFKEKSLNSAKKFARLSTQDRQGRMKPLDTLNKNILLKISTKSTMFDMNANQIILGMLSSPSIWRDVRMIKVKTPKLKKLLGMQKNQKFVSFSEVFKDGKYLLQKEVQETSRSKPDKRGTFEKDILKLDERLNIVFMVYNASLFKIYPKAKEEKNKINDDNNMWYAPLDAINKFKGENQKAIELLTRGFINSVIDKQWKMTNKYIGLISQYQHQAGFEVIPSDTQIENEIFLSDLDIFFKLTIAYMILGLLMLIASFIMIFNPSFKTKKITFVFFIILSILFLLNTFGMGFRWIVSGHAPWTNTYETLLYISWSAIFAAVVFFRKSLLALSAAVILAGIFMFTANLTTIDPQITNLVPVLKSYWLTIHVSILTASYGFFGLACILGYLILIMFIFRKNRPHLDETIKHVIAICEISLIIGLSALTIGNFLGGIWANESWGRYWGWDPKETWAYISIVVYVIVLHLRFIKKLNTPYILSVACVLSFFSILMTYFGVNFYLSGMHSYATGDPVPIPTWVYVASSIVIVTIALAYKNRDLQSSIK